MDPSKSAEGRTVQPAQIPIRRFDGPRFSATKFPRRLVNARMLFVASSPGIVETLYCAT